MSDRESASQLDAVALERLLEVTRALARPLLVDEMLGQVIDAGRTILGAERGTVFLHDAAAGELWSKVATGAGELRVPVTKGIVGECARTRRVINVPDCYADPRFNPEVDRKTGYRTRCLMAVPLIGHDDSLVGVLQVLNKQEGVFTAKDERIARALGAQCAVALQRMRLLQDLVHKERMQQELSVARDIQTRVFPRRMPEIAGYDVAGWCRPADETGGDIYDVIDLGEGRTMLLLGDATGHGIGAALSVTQVRAMLRICVRFAADLDDSFQHINDQLSEDLASNRFVTAFLAVLDSAQHKLRFHCGGIGPIIRFGADKQQAELVESSTFPLGIIGGRAPHPAQEMKLDPGDILVMSTDGIFEYENPSEEQYGIPRLVEVVRKNQQRPLTDLVNAIVAGVERFAAGAPQADDMTLLLLRRRP